MDIKFQDICSIIVIYKPNIKELNRNIIQHLNQFQATILINNDTHFSTSFLKSKNLILIQNKLNIGLSKALNIGILEAKKRGFKFVALFDQDTFFDDKFNSVMIQNINRSIKQNNKFALFSPLCFDLNTHKYLYLYNIKFLRYSKHPPNFKALINYPDFVITSGSYIPLDIIEQVGLMDENLFINFIDIEWCLRAKSKGFKIACFTNINIEHFIGDKSIKLRNSYYPLHNPQRMYYTYRNSLYCYRMPYIEFSWKFSDFYRNIFRFIFYMIFVKNRWRYFKYIIKGCYHGFIKKMGKLKE